MLLTMLLLAVLMLGCHDGAAASDLQVYGKTTRSDKTLLRSDDGRNNVRKQLHHQTSNDVRRSLDFENFNIHVSPTSSKISLPTMTRLYPPTAKPLHMHANLPLRFGRESNIAEDRSPKSTPNLPQRFGRSWEVFRICAECPDVGESPHPALPQRFGRSRLSWSLFRTLASERPVNTGWYSLRDVDFTSSSEEEDMTENLLKDEGDTAY